jgi:SAM-dependent methyltransferase
VTEATAYSFGDNELAAERLALVARIFNPATQAFLERSVPRRPRLALDLGCGPGYTTEIVAKAAEPRRTVGLDVSQSFIESARMRVGARLEFIRHDVSITPFPVGSSDLIFARLLLSHLPQPERLLACWVAELAPGGLLLSDEVERIETEMEQFTRYLALTEERIRSAGGDLYVGPRLDALHGTTGCRQRSSDAVQVAPATGEVAAMFLLNLRAMRGGSRLGVAVPSSELDRIEYELGELTQSTAEGEIVWTLRQTVFSAA